MTSREEVYRAIDSERNYQDKQWQRDVSDPYTDESVAAFLIYIKKYVAKAEDAFTGISGDSTKPVLDVIRKITALGVCAMEMHGAPKREGF